jgi:hypothetical protein
MPSAIIRWVHTFPVGLALRWRQDRAFPLLHTLRAYSFAGCAHRLLSWFDVAELAGAMATGHARAAAVSGLSPRAQAPGLASASRHSHVSSP